MRVALAGLMVVHGFAHLVGFVVPWRILSTPEMPYATPVLAGRVDVGEVGIRMVGLIWLLLTVGFLGAALVTWLDRPGWAGVAMVVAAASLLMCFVGLPTARIGIPVNLVLLGILLAGRARAWW